jgi:activator of HSP90 ATPase
MNTAEALLAVHAIACEAHASSALREAVLHHQDIRLVGQARAQSALMIREAMQVRKELRVMQEERRSAEHAHQQRVEAEEREAEESLRRADETALAPFMRRLAQRQRDGNQPKMSHGKGISTNNKPVRLDQGSEDVSAHAVILDRSSGPPPHGRSRAVVA